MGESNVSIHAPARGATLPRVRGTQPQQVSIHAPARGATSAGRSFAPTRTVSIHAPARGATVFPLTTHLSDTCMGRFADLANTPFPWPRTQQ